MAITTLSGREFNRNTSKAKIAEDIDFEPPRLSGNLYHPVLLMERRDPKQGAMLH